MSFFQLIEFLFLLLTILALFVGGAENLFFEFKYVLVIIIY